MTRARRLAPDRVLDYMFDALSAEVARQCMAEWDAYRTEYRGTRPEAVDRMAILVDLGRQQAALELERRTGWSCAPWSIPKNRRHLSVVLGTALTGEPEDISEQTITRLRAEVERPWAEYRERTTR